MRNARLQVYALRAALGCCLAAGAACHHAPAGASAGQPSAQAAERSRSSATQSVDFNEEERSRFTRVELMIQAHFSGVQVTPKGNGFSIRIRGTGSFGANNEPLVVVDGASRSTADLAGINPREVERIELVKDAAASFYGMRGANGVIVIKTRRGR